MHTCHCLLEVCAHHLCRRLPSWERMPRNSLDLFLYGTILSVVSKSVSVWTSAEICLPIYGVRWLVNATDTNFKYECATFYILARSHTVRLLATQLSTVGKTQVSISSLQRHMLLCKVQNSGDAANGAVVHGLLTIFSFSVPSPSHI